VAANVAPAAPVGIIGIGGLGSLAVQFAKALGHPVVAVDNREEGRALATEPNLKADLVLDFGDSEAVDKIKSWAGRDGLAAVIVCTDNVEATEWSLNTLRPHGVAVPLGLPTTGFKFDAFTVIFNEIVIKGSLVATRDQAEDMLRVVADHQIESHLTVVPFDDAPKLPDMYMSSNLKGRLVLKVGS
jgi:D-arabinose 1-dehydrogenase-like Zn-dependent alcohol dehydrogenase